jgi:hypothetical protein
VSVARRFLRFIPPLVVAIAGWVSASLIVLYAAGQVGLFSPTYNLIEWLPGTVAQDVAWLLGIVPLAGILVYIILGVPFAAIILLIVKLVRSTAYDVDIAQIGYRFSGVRMIRRAATPALFAVAISGIVMELIAGWIIPLLITIPPEVAILINFFMPIVGTLILLPVVLAIFIPTWMLNDSGIVMHLKPEQLDIRRCPDSIGIGRWVNNLMAGFTIFTIPFVMFAQQFLPLIGTTSGPEQYLFATVFSIGIPFLAIAFVIPVVIFHEICINGAKKGIRGLARRLGAREIRIQTVVSRTSIVDQETEYSWSRKSQKKR